MRLTHKDLGVWLINLDRAEKRRADMQARLAALALPYTQFRAVDGKAEAAALEHTVDRAAYERNTGSHLLPGKIGCYHSHMRVWQELVTSDYPVALILEDDVVFHDDFLTSVDAALSVMDQWDTIRFNCVRAKIPVTQSRVGPYKLNAYIGPFTGNGAYLIKRETAARLLPNLLPMQRPFDRELNRFFVHNFRQRGLEPWSSHIDDDGTSTITGVQNSDLRKKSMIHRIPSKLQKYSFYVQRIIYLLQSGALLPWLSSKK